MPRPMKVTAAAIQRARRDWYAFHFEKRTKFQTLPINEKHIYENAAMRIPPPTMTLYGGLPEGYPSREDFQMLCKIHGMLDVDLCNPWYVSEAGWQQFQETWHRLPEPVDFSTEACVQKYPLIHIVHSPTEFYPGSRA